MVQEQAPPINKWTERSRSLERPLIYLLLLMALTPAAAVLQLVPEDITLTFFALELVTLVTVLGTKLGFDLCERLTTKRA